MRLKKEFLSIYNNIRFFTNMVLSRKENLINKNQVGYSVYNQFFQKAML